MIYFPVVVSSFVYIYTLLVLIFVIINVIINEISLNKVP